MAAIKYIPPSIPLLNKRIEHYTKLHASTKCESQQACYSLVITELELIIGQLIEEEP